MKFIHAADIHLDSPLRGLDAYPDSPADRLRGATRAAFERLVNHAVEEKVDFLIIAGDLYDGDWKDHNTGIFFVKQMSVLKRAGIPVFVLYGNHDADSEMTKMLQLPDNVHAFSSKKAQTFKLDALRVALHGYSFARAATTDNLVPAYPDPVAGWLNIGVLHTALEGNAAHPRYAPCSVSELQAKGYQYWALGHVHEHAIIRGSAPIAYPGNLQGRHIGECGVRGALMVSFDADQVTQIDRIELDVLRWHLLPVDISTAVTLDDAVRQAGQQLEQFMAEQAADLPYAVRVVFTGQSLAHGQLVANEVQLRAELISKAVGLDADRIWIEKVKINSHALRQTRDADTDELSGSVFAGLETVAAQLSDSDDLFRELLGDIESTIHQVPHDIIKGSEDLHAVKQTPDVAVRRYVSEALDLLRDKLQIR